MHQKLCGKIIGISFISEVCKHTKKAMSKASIVCHHCRTDFHGLFFIYLFIYNLTKKFSYLFLHG